MPVITNKPYTPPRILFNRHLETIYPALLRKVVHNGHESLSIDTADNDFLELDWYKGYSGENVVIISHGLEGSSSRPYMKGMARAFNLNGWDAISWNYRGCGTELNRTKIFYHSGATYDLDEIVSFASNHYKRIFLVGFSLGGNLTLKYLGEKGNTADSRILGATVFSAPVDLLSCSRELEKRHNYLYKKRFLKNLKKKILAKSSLLQEDFPVDHLSKINTIYEFDELFTAPIHGFKNARDYYEKCSSLHFIDAITIPTLVVNAKNDPFLTPLCYPVEIAQNHQYLHLETPDRGGHVGFSIRGNETYWSEYRANEFAKSLYLKRI